MMCSVCLFFKFLSCPSCLGKCVLLKKVNKQKMTKMKWTKHKSHTKVFYILGFVSDFRVSKINLFCFKNCRQFYEVPNPTYTTLEDCILVHVASKLIRFSAWVSLKNLIGKNLTKDSLLFVYKLELVSISPLCQNGVHWIACTALCRMAHCTTTACTVCPALIPFIVGNKEQVIASVVKSIHFLKQCLHNLCLTKSGTFTKPFDLTTADISWKVWLK